MSCPTCGRDEVLKFRDWISFQEWVISGMCQDCQDSVFESDEDPHVKTGWDSGQ